LQFESRLGAAESALACAEAHLEVTAATEGAPLATFSASQIAHHARAIRVYLAVQRSEPDLAIELARAALEALPKETAQEPRVVRGAVTLGLGIGHFQLGQTEAAYRALQRALPLNRRDGNRYAALSCIYYLMRIDRLQGALGQALSTGREGLLWAAQWSSAGGRRRPLARVSAHIRHTMALVHYERDELEEAARHLGPSTEYYALVGSRYQVRGYALLVDLHHAMGAIEDARESLDRLVQTVGAAGFSLPDTPVEAMIARRRLLLSRADAGPDDLLAGAIRWAEALDLDWGDTLTYKREYELLTLAQVRVVQGRAAEALPLLARLVAGARDAAREGQLVAYLAFQAIAHHACGQVDAAQDALSRALALGEPEGYVRTFVDHGAPMVDLLRQARERGAPSSYVDRLLAAMPGETMDDGRRTETKAPSSVAGGPSSTPGPSSPSELSSALVEPLNDRELQVLRLLAAGLSDRQIGEELYLSVNTVKWYNRQIYGKLGVGRRGQAVARARELGLL
jgi:LuxR family maltose regulon positive regulatory protein